MRARNPNDAFVFMMSMACVVVSRGAPVVTFAKSIFRAGRAQSLVHLGMRGTQAEFSLEFEPGSAHDLKSSCDLNKALN